MKLEKFAIYGVDTKGIVAEGGAVNPNGGIVIVKGNCGSKGCHCSDGFSISLVMPRNEAGIVEGIICKFDNLKEMREKLK